VRAHLAPALFGLLFLSGCVAPAGGSPGGGEQAVDDDDTTVDDTTGDDDDLVDDDDASDPTPLPVELADCDEAHPGATVGLRLCTTESEDGYLLLSSFSTPTTWLLDPLGRVVHTWDSDRLPGMSVILRDDGVLVRALHDEGELPQWSAVRGGSVEALSWDGAVLWDFTYASQDVFRHHDIELMPNGDVVLVAYERKTRAEALERGRDPELLVGPWLWPDHIVQIDPSTGQEVWSWHVWDHLVQDREPALPEYAAIVDRIDRIDINAVLPGAPAADGPDWNHMNTVSYDPVRDEFLMTALSQSEVWVVAREGAGDLVWRWGNEQIWGGLDDPTLAGPHDAQRIAPGLPGEGNLLIYNNNGASDGGSAVVEIAPRMDGEAYARNDEGWAGAQEVWRYEAPGFHSFFASGAQRLRGGNTFVTEAINGRMFEVTPDGRIVWEYVSPAVQSGLLEQGQVPQMWENAVFKATRIAADHPALVGRDLTPGDPLVEAP
jgi:hypothetical protein